MEGSNGKKMLSDNGYHVLANAIILQAIKDFQGAYRILKKYPDSKAAEAEVKEISEFFCSEYFMMLTDTDGPTLLRKIKKEIDENGLVLLKRKDTAKQKLIAAYKARLKGVIHNEHYLEICG